MNKKQIPEPDLKLLVDFLKKVILPDLEFQAVYDAVMASFSVQVRLFKALTSRENSFVDVRIRRKSRRILLDFAVVPEFIIADAISESKNKAESLPVEVETVTNSSFDNEKAVLSPQNSEVLPVLEPSKQKKVHGKAKKTPIPRSVISFLVDDADIEKLQAMAIDKDLTVSHIARAAIRQYLNQI